MKYILNQGQENIKNLAKDFYYHSYDQVFEFDGEAGTGKSVVLRAIVEELGISEDRILPMAYTGQAAIVMRTKGFRNAKTIHSTLLEPVEIEERDTMGRVMMDTTFNKPIMKTEYLPRKISPNDYDLMIIDEGRMVPDTMRRLIENPGIKVIVAGDEGQLPPVVGKPAYIYDPSKIHHLTELMRQAKDSALIYLAHRARRGLPIHAGYYPSKYGNVLVIEENELNDQMIMYANIVLTGTNRTRDRMNKYVREELMGITSSVPVRGERVICRKNNWNRTVDDISLANGLTGTVITPPDVTRFDGDMYFMDFLPDLIGTPFLNLDCDYLYFNAKPEERNFLKNNKYNKANKFESAYALTTHLAQGAEYPQGIYFQENMGDPSIRPNIDYTGITRFRNNAIIVIRSRRFW